MKELSKNNAFTVEGKKGSMKVKMDVAKFSEKPNNSSYISMQIAITC